MAKVSVDNGYGRLSNDLAREIGARAFTARQFAILFQIIPETYGFKGRATAHLSPAFLADTTGIDIENVRKALNAMVSAKVIQRLEDGAIGINPRIDEWQIQDRRTVKSTGVARSNQPGSVGQINRGGPVESTGKPRSNQPVLSVESTGSTPFNAPDDAAFQERKETPKERKKEHGHGMALVGLAAIAAQAEWFDGEQGRFLALLNLTRLADLGMVLGESAQKVKTYVAFPVSARRKAWSFLDAKLAGGERIGKPLGFLLAYLQDPARFPAVEGINAPEAANVVEFKRPEPAANPYADKPWGALNEQRNFGYRWADEKDQVRYLIERVITLAPGPGAYDDLTAAYRDGGLEGALAAIWARWPKKREGTNG